MAEKNINYHIFNDDPDAPLDLDIKTEVYFSGKDHPQGKMVPVSVEGKEEYILIPLDVKDGSIIKVSGRGKHHPRSGKTGDLYVNIHIGEEKRPPNIPLICALALVAFIAAFGIGALLARLAPPKEDGNSMVPASEVTTQATTNHVHQWIEATYDSPKTCEICGATEGETLEKPSIQIDDIVTFGNYEQDGLRKNGTEPIEWIVLDVREDKALLLSCYALDSQPYNKAYAPVTWEECTLRNWLNSTFLNAAFTEDEKKKIEITEIDNSRAQGNSEWRISGGNNTEDSVFLLSYEESEQYFDSSFDRICLPTSYAVSQGADIRVHDDGITESGWWWLRSPGEAEHHAAFVNFDGTRYTNAVGNEYLSVRPALWIKLI